MTLLLFARRIVPAVAAGLLLSFCIVIHGHANAAEIKILTSVALTAALNELAPKFEQATGNKLNIGYNLIADIRKRILEGETADVIILSRPVMDELQKQDKFAPGSTIDALKHTLLNAKSIVYADPSKGGASGVYFARVIDRLGIADQLKSKTILMPAAQAADIVAKGEAEIGIRQTSEIVPVAGADLLGPRPR